MKRAMLAVALLLDSSSATAIKGRVAGKNNKAMAEEYLRQVYAQVGATYLAQTDEEGRGRTRKPRRVITPEEFKDYGNLYPAETAVAMMRGDPWPCSAAEPCGEGEGTCFNPYETREHPDAWCKVPLSCQERKGGSRGGKGEAVRGVVWTGALKMHHMGANDICYDDLWEKGGKDPDTGAPFVLHRAVLRRKARPCTREHGTDEKKENFGRPDTCDVGQGPCGGDNGLCNEGLHCKFGDTEAEGAGEPIHGIEYVGDLLHTDPGANDLCYNPHWPNSPFTTYEGMVVRSKGSKDRYVVIDSARHLIPDDETFLALWPGDHIVIELPNDAFKNMVVTEPLCHMAPLIKGVKKDHVYLMLDGEKRHIANAETFHRYQFRDDAIHTMPQCAVDGIKDGAAITYVAGAHDIANKKA